MQLARIEVAEQGGWQVEVNRIRVFKDDKLSLMKSKYEHTISTKGKAVFFPELGILAVGCGEKKNRGEGKYLLLGSQKEFKFIDIYD